jgi:hypothetical protein
MDRPHTPRLPAPAGNRAAGGVDWRPSLVTTRIFFGGAPFFTTPVQPLVGLKWMPGQKARTNHGKDWVGVVFEGADGGYFLLFEVCILHTASDLRSYAMVNRRNMKKSSGRVTALRTEILESRAMMAGDVTVHVIDGNLVVEGDAEGNRIGIASGMDPGTYLVAGLPSDNGDVTTVNGQTGRVPFTGVRGNILVGLGEGNDSVVMPELRAPGMVRIRMGAGNDHVRLGVPPVDGAEPTGPTVHIRGGVALSLGDGEDAAALFGVQAHSVMIAGGADADRIGLNGVHSERGIVVNGGVGDDQIAIHRVRSRVLEVLGEAGNDNARITDTGAMVLGVHLGSGDDTLAIGHTTALMAYLDGGEGNDTLTNLQGNRFGRRHIRNFEHRGGDETRGLGELTDLDTASTDALLSVT